MTELVNLEDTRLRLSPHRWRIILIDLTAIISFSLVSMLREFGLTSSILAQCALILVFGAAGWFGFIPLWQRFNPKLIIALGLWLLPPAALALVGLMSMREIAEVPVLLYLTAPFVRLSQPDKYALLPKTKQEWTWELALLVPAMIFALMPWDRVASMLITLILSSLS